MAGRKIKVGIVGVGYMGKLHLKGFLSSERAEVVGVYDIDLEKGKGVERSYGVKAFSSLRDLLEKVDAISVATPTEAHFEVAREVIARGKHLLLEKPITHEVSLADKLVREAKRRGIVFQIGHIERYNPAVQELFKRVNAPFRIETERYGFPISRNLRSGVILDLMIHDIDILLAMLREEPRSFEARAWCAYSDEDDMAEAVIEFNSAVAHLKVGRLHPYKSRKMRVWDRKGDKVRLFELDFIKQLLKVYSYPLNPDRFKSEGVFEERFEFGIEDLIQLEVESFLEAISENREPVVKAEDGVKALDLALRLKEKAICKPI